MALESQATERRLGYTGHPFVDIGLATIAAFVGKEEPSDLVEEDLGEVAGYMQENYTRNPLRSFLTVVFPNSGYTQPAYDKQPEKRDLYAQRVLHSFRADTPTLAPVDFFLGLPIPDVPYDVKGELPPGRAYRQHIPLTMGEDVINFGAQGQPGLAISGAALLAIQAFPLGCAKCGGRLLAVHSDSPELLWHFAHCFLVSNRQCIQLAQQAESSKMPESAHSPLTLLIKTLLEAEWRGRREMKADRPFSVTAYHLSNSGQSPSLDIYHLPFPVAGFLQKMQLAEYAQEWQQIVARAWQKPRPKKGQEVEGTFVPRYNSLYEDLFRLPDTARSFLRTYLLRVPRRNPRDEQDPRNAHSPRAEAQLVSWKITDEFLKGVMHMDAARIALIRDLGDRLAQYVSQQNDKRFFRQFFTTNRYWELRMILLRASHSNLQRGQPPLIDFDSYIAVFEDAEDLQRGDWGLARDLVLIRLMERLYQLRWLQQNPEALPEAEELEQVQEAQN